MMDVTLKNLPVSDRLQLVEELWDSIALEQHAVPVTDAQRKELNLRLERMESSPDSDRNIQESLKDLRNRL